MNGENSPAIPESISPSIPKDASTIITPTITSAITPPIAPVTPAPTLQDEVAAPGATPEDAVAPDASQPKTSPSVTQDPIDNFSTPVTSSSSSSTSTSSTLPTPQPVEEASAKPEVPPALISWLEFGRAELAQLRTHQKLHLLDYPMVRATFLACCLVCPSKSLRGKISHFRECGVRGTSLVPYLNFLDELFSSVSSADLDDPSAPSAATTDPAPNDTPAKPEPMDTAETKVEVKPGKKRAVQTSPATRNVKPHVEPEKTAKPKRPAATKPAKSPSTKSSAKPSDSPFTKSSKPPKASPASPKKSPVKAVSATSAPVDRVALEAFIMAIGKLFIEKRQPAVKLEAVMKLPVAGNALSVAHRQQYLQILEDENRIMQSGDQVFVI